MRKKRSVKVADWLNDAIPKALRWSTTAKNDSMSGRSVQLNASGTIQKRRGASGLVPRAPDVWKIPKGFIAQEMNHRIWVAPTTQKRHPEQFIVTRDSGIELVTAGKHPGQVYLTRYFNMKTPVPKRMVYQMRRAAR